MLAGGRYRLTSRLARGAMGAVFRGVDQSTGADVAIKILDLVHQQPDKRTRSQARFFREASLLSRLHHPHTVRIYDYGAERGYPWLAMELIGGQPLERIMGDRPMPALRVVRIVQQICASLSEAHSMGLVHRDLKPANVLVQTHEGGDFVKVVDFGLVKPVRTTEELTVKGLLVGTPMYMSPEQIRGEQDLDQRSDLYGLGVLMYRCLMGHHPFPHEATAAVLVAHINEAPAPIPASLGLPESLCRVVMLCLEKDRRRRVQTVDLLAEELHHIEAELAARHAPRSSRLLMTTLFALGVGVMVCGGLAALVGFAVAQVMLGQ